MPLFKAYVGPVGNSFELVLAIQNADQEKDIEADVFLFERNSGVELFRLNRRTLTYSATDTYITGGVLKVSLTVAQAAILEADSGYTRVEDDGNFYFIYGNEVSLRDFSNATEVTVDSTTDTTSTVTVAGDSYVECTVTDQTGLRAIREERVVIANGRGAEIDGPATINPSSTDDYTLQTARLDGSTFFTNTFLYRQRPSDENRIRLIPGPEPAVNPVAGAIYLPDVDQDAFLPLEEGGSVTIQLATSPTPEAYEDFTLEAEYATDSGAQIITDTIRVHLANQPPAVTIEPSLASPVSAGTLVEYTATVLPVEEQVGGTYVWYVDNVRRETTTDPTNTFDLVFTNPTSGVQVYCIFFDALGLNAQSNTEITTWQ